LGCGGFGAGTGAGRVVGQVVDIIRKRKGMLVGQSDEVEVDINTLDNQTLRELEKYVNQCLNPSQPPASRKGGRPGGGNAKGGAAAAAVGGPSGWAAQKSESSGSESESESEDSDKDGLTLSGAWDGGGAGPYSLSGPGHNT
jgi:hypothetical protein